MYQNVSEEEKDKKRQFVSERYRNTSKEEKEKKRQYGREQCEQSSKGYVQKKFFQNARNKDYLSIKHFYYLVHGI